MQKHAPPRLCANATYRRTLGNISMNRDKLHKLLTITWITIGLCYLIWGLYWFINYQFRPGVLWLIMIPNTHLIRTISFGTLLIYIGILLNRKNLLYKKFIFLSIYVIVLYTILITIGELIIYGNLISPMLFFDLILVLLPLMTYRILLKYLDDLKVQNNTKVNIRFVFKHLAYFVIIPYSISLLLDYLWTKSVV